MAKPRTAWSEGAGGDPCGDDAPGEPVLPNTDGATGRQRVVGDGTVGRFDDVNQGDLSGSDRRSCSAEEPPGRSQSVHSSVETGQCRWSQGTQEGGSVTTRRRNPQAVTVPFAATPAEASAPISAWAHPVVWTERMLATLETGVRGGKWHTLIDKVFAEKNLEAACTRVVANRGAAGVDHVNVEGFEARRAEELPRLAAALRTGEYRPQAVRRVLIPKPGSNEPRPLGIPTVRDRVVQTALLHVLEPIFDRTFAEHSYGFRPGRGCHHALERVEALLGDGCVYVVDADLKAYFDTIPYQRLLARVAERVSDRRVGIGGTVPPSGSDARSR